MVETIRWKGNKVELIDQRLLPGRKVYVACESDKDIYDAIKTMKIRGAPAIGVAAAYGVYLGLRYSRTKKLGVFEKELKRTVSYLASSRPTAVNLFWALSRMENIVKAGREMNICDIKDALLAEAHEILDEDNKICRAIGRHGKQLLAKGSVVLTHCNAGGLATASYGTALGVIFSSRSKIKKVFVDETRPVLQGARLTAWELVTEGIPAVLICDNMAASILAKGEIDVIIVGADRIAANGDTANKIGTYNLAVLANYHKIPFYVAAPVSTFDLAIKSGKSIPIEERDHSEIKKIGECCLAPKKIDVYNPAFDITPAKLITAIITERGAIRSPNSARVKGILGKKKKLKV